MELSEVPVEELQKITLPEKKPAALTIEQSKPTRREVLKGAAVALALALSPRVPEAQVEKDSGVRKNYLETLRKEAIHNDHEQSYFYNKYPDGREETYKADSETSGKTHAYLTFDMILKPLKEGAQSVEYSHTHPMSMLLLTAFDNKEITQAYLNTLRSHSETHKEDDVYPYHPPSFTDIYASYKARKYLSKYPEYSHEKLKFTVGDSPGVWKFDVQPDNPFMRKYDKFVKKAAKLMSKYERDPAVVDYKYQSGLKNPDEDPRLLGINLLTDQALIDKLSDKSKQIREKIIKYEQSLDPGVSQIMENEIGYASISPTNRSGQKEAIEQMKKTYVEKVINISFTPYSELLNKK